MFLAETRDFFLPDDCTAIFVTGVRNYVEIWRPEFKLSLPVDDCWQRGTDQKWPLTVALKKQEVYTKISASFPYNMSCSEFKNLRAFLKNDNKYQSLKMSTWSEFW